MFFYNFVQNTKSNISKESSRYTQVMINGMPWVNTLRDDVELITNFASEQNVHFLKTPSPPLESER